MPVTGLCLHKGLFGTHNVDAGLVAISFQTWVSLDVCVCVFRLSVLSTAEAAVMWLVLHWETPRRRGMKCCRSSLCGLELRPKYYNLFLFFFYGIYFQVLLMQCVMSIDESINAMGKICLFLPEIECFVCSLCWFHLFFSWDRLKQLNHLMFHLIFFIFHWILK